jgi:DNA polymerase
MARAVLGGYARHGFSLGALAELFELKSKGDYPAQVIGRHRSNLTPTEFHDYGEYCINDCTLTRQLFSLLRLGWRGQFIATLVEPFPTSELKLIDKTIRMFTEPVCHFDTGMLAEHYNGIIDEKDKLFVEVGQKVGFTKTQIKQKLGSADAFAHLLKMRGVTPPMKISPTTGKKVYAFAKTDEKFTDLKNHHDPLVKKLVTARLKLKSAIEETRTKVMYDMSKRGKIAAYYKYSGADQTHRFSGGDGTNFQNLPRDGVIRDAICAPEGHSLLVVDSSNIEARVVDTLAQETEAIQVYRDNDAGIGPDIYCYMASKYFNKEIVKDRDKKERQFGKTLKLACGFGMGWAKFQDTCRVMAKIDISNDEAATAVGTYRTTHSNVKRLWYKAQDLFPDIQRGVEVPLDYKGIVNTATNAFALPNGLMIKYPNLRQEDFENEWFYDSGRVGITKLYGGKAIENVVQALARIIVMEQCMAVSRLHKDCPWVMTSHDEGVWVVPDKIIKQVMADALAIFRTPPKWWDDLPVNAEAGYATRYGWAK